MSLPKAKSGLRVARFKIQYQFNVCGSGFKVRQPPTPPPAVGSQAFACVIFLVRGTRLLAAGGFDFEIQSRGTNTFADYCA